MRAGLQQGALDQRRRRNRRRGNDVGRGQFGVEVACGGGVEAFGAQFGRQFFGIGGGAVPDADLLDRADRRMGARQERRHGARADHQQARSVFARQIGGGKCGGAGRAPLGQALAVDQRLRLAGRAVEQEVDPHHRRLAEGVVAGRNGDDLDAHMAFGGGAGGHEIGPCGHQQQGRSRRIRLFDVVVMAHRLHGAVTERRAQRLHEAGKSQGTIDVGGRKGQHGRFRFEKELFKSVRVSAWAGRPAARRAAGPAGS